MRALCQISAVLPRKSDILHHLDSIIIMVFRCSVHPVRALSLSFSLPFSFSSSSSRFSARPPEDADVVLMTAMERVHVRGCRGIAGWGCLQQSALPPLHLDFRPVLMNNTSQQKWGRNNNKKQFGGILLRYFLCNVPPKYNNISVFSQEV